MSAKPSIKLQDEYYINLSTRKKSGDHVNTPVWFAQHNNTIYIFSSGDAGKVKRMRNFPSAKIAPCTVSGKLLGEWIEVSSRIIDDPSIQHEAYKALLKKYGWQMKILDLISSLFKRKESRAFFSLHIRT